MNNDMSGNEMSEVMKMMASDSKAMGGRRRTRKGRRSAVRKTLRGGKRKLGKALSEWNKSVMKVFREMKSKNKDVKLKDAMKETKRRKDRGQL